MLGMPGPSNFQHPDTSPCRFASPKQTASFMCLLTASLLSLSQTLNANVTSVVPVVQDINSLTLHSRFGRSIPTDPCLLLSEGVM